MKNGHLVFVLRPTIIQKQLQMKSINTRHKSNAFVMREIGLHLKEKH